MRRDTCIREIIYTTQPCVLASATTAVRAVEAEAEAEAATKA